MVALRIICTILAMALLTSAAPHDSQEEQESGEHSQEEEGVHPGLKFVCPDGNSTCKQKLQRCNDQMEPKTADQKAYDKLWIDNVEQCREKFLDITGDDQIDLETESLWEYCQRHSLEMMNVTTNGAVNREEVRRVLKARFANSSPEVQTAVLDGINNCDYVEKEFFTTYIPCIMKNCVSTLQD